MTEHTSGSAIGQHREDVQSQSRPSRLQQDVNVRDAVEAARQDSDLYKVYRPEWIMQFTSNSAGEAGRVEAVAYFDQKYEGRVRDEDVQYQPASTKAPDYWPWRLLVRLPNIKGEFKTKVGAEEYVALNGWDDAQVVARNSRAEYAIKDYSVKKLPQKRA